MPQGPAGRVPAAPNLVQDTADAIGCGDGYTVDGKVLNLGEKGEVYLNPSNMRL